MKNTIVYVLPSIPRPNYRVDLQSLAAGVRKWFQFHFVERERPLAVPATSSSSSSSSSTTTERVVVVRCRNLSSEQPDVDGDPWQEQSFIPTGNLSKATPRPKKLRLIIPAASLPASVSLSSRDPQPPATPILKKTRRPRKSNKEDVQKESVMESKEEKRPPKKEAKKKRKKS